VRLLDLLNDLLRLLDGFGLEQVGVVVDCPGRARRRRDSEERNGSRQQARGHCGRE